MRRRIEGGREGGREGGGRMEGACVGTITIEKELLE